MSNRDYERIKDSYTKRFNTPSKGMENSRHLAERLVDRLERLHGDIRNVENLCHRAVYEAALEFLSVDDERIDSDVALFYHFHGIAA